MRVYVAALVLAVGSLVSAGDIAVTGNTTVAPGDMAILTVVADDATGFYWTATNHERAVFDPLKNGSNVAFATGTPGRYRWVVSVREGEISTPVMVEIVVGDAPEPTPTPDDVPDPPTPDVEPIIPGDGYRVMILYETSDVLSAEQQAILTSVKLRQYLRETTARDGQTPAYRVWTDDYEPGQLAHEVESWRESYPRVKAAAESLPWIVATNGDKQVSAPLPATVDETIALLKTVE